MYNHNLFYNIYSVDELFYDLNGNIGFIDFRVDGFVYDYKFQYDNTGQILTADYCGNEVDYDYTIQGYDANGNFAQSNSRDYTYITGTNKVQNAGGSQYVYDYNGNIISSDKPERDLTLNYDPVTKMTKKIQFQNPEFSGEIRFYYNSFNERVLKYAEINGETYKKLYLRGLSAFPLAETDDEGMVTFYIYGPDGLLAKEVDTETNYIIQDHLGSTRVVLNESNVIVTCYNFDAFGNLMPSTVSEEVAYQYTGQEYDSEIDLHNFRARFYDSDLMRFYAVDPAMQTASPYLFCGNNPIMYVDEDGEWFLQALYIGYQIYKAYTVANTVYHVVDAISSGNYGAAVQTAIQFGNAQIAGCASFGAFTSGFDYNPILSTISGAVSGAAGGALSAAVTGQDIGKGAISGAVVGGVLGLATSQNSINLMEGEGFHNDETVYNNYMSKGKNGFDQWTQHLSRKYNRQIIAGDGFEHDHATGIITLDRNQTSYGLQISGLDHELGHSMQKWQEGREAEAKREMGATNSVIENQGRYYGIDRTNISDEQIKYQDYHNNGGFVLFGDPMPKYPNMTYKARWYHFVPIRSNMARYLKWGYSNVWQ